MKSIILCADDFGLNKSVSQGILQLVRMRRLSAVSCMVNQPDFASYAQELKVLRDEVQIGLHFNLTEGVLLSQPERPCFNFNQLLLASKLHLIDLNRIAQELQAQMDQFIEVLGKKPDFIDGHQHVHQFPGIRQVLLSFYQQHLGASSTWIRSTYPGWTLPAYKLKGLILAWSGGKKLHQSLKTFVLPHPTHFAGVYDFSAQAHYPSLFKRWLALVPSDTLIMCHPGKEPMAGDRIGQARYLELHYFSSEAFLHDLQEHQCILFKP